MTSMFWGLRLEPGKRYSTTVDKSFHVSMAALDCNTVKNEKDIHTVMLEEGESNVPFILCNLQKPKNLQSALDLNFMSGDRLTLFCRGNGTVHLSGYIISDEDDDDDDMAEFGEEEEEEEEEDEIEDDEEMKESIEDAIKNKLNGMTKKKRKGDGSEVSPAKKKKIDSDDDDDDENDDDDDESGEEAEEDADEEEEADSDEASEEDDEEEESEHEETTVKQLQQQIQKTKKQKQQEQQKNKDQAKSPGGKQQQQKAQQSPGQQSKQQKIVNGVPEQGKKAKGGQKGEGGVSTKLEGGVHVQDVKVGNGPICKPGKMVTVFYTGKLKNNNKVFDETKQGPGFKFRLGQGDVIKGWDVGLSGMKVGGKRVITCPPNMAYGSKGAPPTIPANSTLVFEVELKAVN